MPPDSIHYHAVAENKPVKAQRFAQKAVHDRARHRGRNTIWLNVREEDVAAHYGGNARLDRRAERNELARFELVHRFLDAGKPDVGIHGGVAVAGEMLAAAEHAAVFIALHSLCAEERDALRIVAEAAHADHGVHGVGVHVEIGREIEIHADTAQLPRRDLRGENGIFRLSGRGKRHAAGDVHRVPREARHHAALLVDGDKGVAPGRAADKLLNIGAQPRELRRLSMLYRKRMTFPILYSRTSAANSAGIVVPGKPNTSRCPIFSRMSINFPPYS